MYTGVYCAFDVCTISQTWCVVKCDLSRCRYYNCHITEPHQQLSHFCQLTQHKLQFSCGTVCCLSASWGPASQKCKQKKKEEEKEIAAVRKKWRGFKACWYGPSLLIKSLIWEQYIVPESKQFIHNTKERHRKWLCFSWHAFFWRLCRVFIVRHKPIVGTNSDAPPPPPPRPPRSRLNMSSARSI